MNSQKSGGLEEAIKKGEVMYRPKTAQPKKEDVEMTDES